MIDYKKGIGSRVIAIAGGCELGISYSSRDNCYNYQTGWKGTIYSGEKIIFDNGEVRRGCSSGNFDYLDAPKQYLIAARSRLPIYPTEADVKVRLEELQDDPDNDDLVVIEVNRFIPVERKVTLEVNL